MMSKVEFTLMHHGVPIGNVIAGADNIFPRNDDPASDIDLVFLPFVPSEGYPAVGPVFQLAYRAFRNFGFLGPAADPASDAAGKNAAQAASGLWAEIEIWDSSGRPVSGCVTTFYECGVDSEQPYWVDIRLDPSAAGVVASIR